MRKLLEQFKKIYALCDFELLEKYKISLEKYLNIISVYDIVYIQYRDKINNVNIQKQNLQYLKTNTNIPIIINDHLDLLEFSDGLHMGQEDLEYLSKENKLSKKDFIKQLKKTYPKKILGLSTHDKKEIEQANSFDLDYIGLGAYRTTTTKDVNNCLGNSISNLALVSKFPVGAIGGVKIEDNIKNISYNVIGSALLK